MICVQSYKSSLCTESLTKYTEGVNLLNATNALFESVILEHYLEDMVKTIRLLVTLQLVSRAQNARALGAYPLREREIHPIQTFLFLRELTEDFTMEQTEEFQRAWSAC